MTPGVYSSLVAIFTLETPSQVLLGHEFPERTVFIPKQLLAFESSVVTYPDSRIICAAVTDARIPDFS